MQDGDKNQEPTENTAETQESIVPEGVKEKTKKPSQQEIMETLSNVISGGVMQKVLFRDYLFPIRAHIEEDVKGARRILVEGKEKVVRYVSPEYIRNAILTYTASLPKGEYWAYKINPRQAQTITDYWMATTRPFAHEVRPIAQKGTDHYTFHRLDFKMEDEPTETFDYLMSLFEINAEPAMAYLGALFDPSRTLQQYLWITGEHGGEGKGSLIRLLARIFTDSYIPISTESREIDKYWQASLVGKRLAVCTEVQNTSFVTSSIFKQITGGDLISIREMREKPFLAKLNTMFVLCANEEPAITTEGSVVRRSIVARMSKENFRYIDNFEEKLWAERSGILFKIWNAWLKHRDKPAIESDISRLADLGSETEEYYQVLVDRYFEIGDDFRMSPSNLRMCLDMEKVPMKRGEFSSFKRWLKRIYGVEAKNQRANKQVSKWYMGIRERSKDSPSNREVDY